MMLSADYGSTILGNSSVSMHVANIHVSTYMQTTKHNGLLYLVVHFIICCNMFVMILSRITYYFLELHVCLKISYYRIVMNF